MGFNKKIWFLGGFTKKQYRGDCLKKGIGKFAYLRGGLTRNSGEGFEGGLISTPMHTMEKHQTDEISNFFREIFEKDNQGTAKECPPCSIKKPFTEKGISMASKKLRNGKNPGIDNMHTEYILICPRNNTPNNHWYIEEKCWTDDYLEILKEGILTPLQTPPKKTKNGEKKTKNLRPVILLPTVRNIFAICIIEQGENCMGKIEISSSLPKWKKHNWTSYVY